MPVHRGPGRGLWIMSAAPRIAAFDPPSASVFGAAAQWIEGALFGSVAAALCVVAVASVGLLMLTGRLPVRRGLEVVLGCFVLLGAPVIAGAFIAGAQQQVAPPPIPPQPVPPARAELPPSDYSPYAGASLRSD